MQIKNGIEEMRVKLLKDIEKAAKSGDTVTIQLNSKKLDEIERLRVKLSDIENSFLALKKNEINIHNRNTSATVSDYKSNIQKRISPSYKEQGKKRRMEFLKAAELLGIIIVHDQGVKYRIGTKLICIPTASGNNPDRWFMGFPPDNYSAVVLICENSRNECIRFILNGELYKKIAKYQSTNNDGQLKFNVLKNGQHYFLKLTSIEKIKIDSFIDNFELLRSF